MWASAMLLSVLLQVLPPVPIIPSPTMIPSITPQPTLVSPLDEGDTYNYLATAAANVGSLPDNMEEAGDVVLIPKANTSTLLGYGRWLFSSNSANELFGTTIAPVAIHFFSILTAVVVLAVVYFIVRIVLVILRFVAWLVQQVLKFIPFVGMFLVQIPTPTPMPAPAAAPIDIPSNYNLWYFADESVGWWNRLGSDKTQVIQIVVIVAIVVFSVITIVNYIRGLTSEKDEQ